MLSTGNAQPSDKSPWWLFHRLSRAARTDLETRTLLVRERWTSFQNHLFETAYHTACEGRRLIDNGRAEEASHLLTTYMAKNVSTMLAMVSEMLSEFQEQTTYAGRDANGGCTG